MLVRSARESQSEELIAFQLIAWSFHTGVPDPDGLGAGSFGEIRFRRP
jgi:hypothetical protein